MSKFQETSETLNSLKAAISKALNAPDSSERRTIGKRFYVTRAEAQQLEALCQGVSLSAFVRAKVLGDRMPRPRAIVPQLHRKTYIDLANLKSNCNQIAKAINIAAKNQQDLPLTQAYLKQLERLEALLVSIGRQLQHGSQQAATDEEPNSR